MLATNPAEHLRSESLWILTTAIANAEQNVVSWMFNNEGQDLIKAFCKNINSLKNKNNTPQLLSVLEAVKILLEINKE
jgi:hypothetical protein